MTTARRNPPMPARQMREQAGRTEPVAREQVHSRTGMTTTQAIARARDFARTRPDTELDAAMLVLLLDELDELRAQARQNGEIIREQGAELRDAEREAYETWLSAGHP